MTMDDKTIDKIKSILRKADETKNPSEAERDTALRMANRLLLKHGLSMADLGDIDGEAESGRDFEHGGAFDIDSEADMWKSLLLHRIGKVYFCEVYRTRYGRGRVRMMMVGRSDYLATAKAMYEFIEPQVIAELNIALAAMTKTDSPHQQQQARLARQYAIAAAIEYLREMEEGVAYTDLEDEELAQMGKDRLEAIEDADEALHDIMALCGLSSMHYAKKARAFIKRGAIASADVENLAVWRRSFLDGAVGRIAKRLKQLMAEEVQHVGETGTALVKNEQADLEQFLDTLDLGLRKRRSSRQVDLNGLAAGREAGDRADLSVGRKVDRGNSKQLGR